MRFLFFLIFYTCVAVLHSQQDLVSWRTFTVGDGSIERKMRPEFDQLYPRGDNNKGLVHFEGDCSSGSTIRIFAKQQSFGGDVQEIFNQIIPLDKGHFVASVEISAGLFEYSFYYQLEGAAPVLIADHVLCGDVYLASGQSNVDTWDLSREECEDLNIKYGPGYVFAPYSQYSRYCRGFGTGLPFPRNLKWGLPGVAYSGFIHLGAWLKVLQHEIVEKENVPVLIIMGAVGSTNISHNHMPEEGEYFFDSLTFFKRPPGVPTSATPAYRLFARLNTLTYAAGVEKNIRGILWMQGDAGNYDISNGYVHEFRKMHALWKKFFPGFKRTYVVQVHSWIENENGMRNISEEQRQLADSIENLVLMSANGIGYHRLTRQGAIHFRSQGYIRLGEQMRDLLLEEEYGRERGEVRPPSVVASARSGNTMRIYFDQLISTDLSDPIKNVLEMIKFDTGYNIKSNGTIVKNKLFFTVEDTNITMVSYAGFLPDKLTEPDYFEPDFPCYLRNRNGIGALSFHKIPVLRYDTNAYYEKLSFPSAPHRFDDSRVFPNPFEESFDIYLPEAENVVNTSVKVIITDLSGRTVFETNIRANPTARVHASGLPAGVYYLHYKTFKQSRREVIIKTAAGN